MSKNKKSNKKDKKVNDDLQFIKKAIEKKEVSISEIEVLSKIEHPLFSFKYLVDVSIDQCEDASFFHDFLIRLQKLSLLGWNEIRTSQRHSFGMEKIGREQIVPKDRLPSFVTREVELDVFRSAGDNRAFVGMQEGKLFHIFFIEAKFGDIYPH